MKTLKTILLLTIVFVTLSGCKSLFITQSTMMKIEKGMTKQQVTQLLGNPDFRQFNNEIEEWVFDKYDKTLVVGFVENRVESMSTFPVGTYFSRDVYYPVPNNAPYPIIPRKNYSENKTTDKDFERIYQTLNDKNFKDEKFQTLREITYKKTFTCVQCARLLSLFSFEDEKFDAFAIIAPHVIDWENKEIVLKNFSFISNRDKAQQIIESLVRREK